MIATNELRQLLDERGVEHDDHYFSTSWIAGGTLHIASEQLDGTLVVDKLTPEQAIAATLGERTCHNKSRFAPGGTRFVCSACDFGSDWDMWDNNCGVPMDFWFDYCPNCGAKVVD